MCITQITGKHLIITLKEFKLLELELRLSVNTPLSFFVKQDLYKWKPSLLSSNDYYK